MQERRKIALTSLLDNKICGYASCVLDLENYIRPNVALVAAHRKGDRFAKKRLKGIVCGTPLEKSSVRNDRNFAPWGRGALRFLDFDKLPFGTTPTQFVNSFFAKFARIDGFEDCCVAEESCSGGCHIFAPALSDDAKADMLFYQHFADSPVDLSCANSSRVALLTGLLICLTSYRPLFTRVDDRIVDELIAMRDALEGTQSVPSAIEKSADLDLLQAVTCELIDELGGYPKKGDRNQFLYKAAAELRSITDCSPEQIAVLLGDHQYFGLPESEALATIRSACKKSEEPKKSEMMRTSIDRALMKSAAPKVEVKLSESCTVIGLSSSSVISSSVPEELPTTPPEEWSPFSEEPPAAIAYKDLPKFARILVQNVPGWTYNHVWNGVEPALATYLCRTEARSIDGGEPIRVGEGFISISVSGPSTGKSSRSPIFACITKKLHEEDSKCRAAIQAYNELSRRTKTADLPAKPEWTSQILGADCSAAALMMRLRAATGALLINADELSMLSGLQSNTSDANTPLLLAFASERHVVERSTDVAEAGAVNMRLNIAGHGTPYQFEKFAANGFHNGLLSRLSLSKILPAGEFTGYGSYDGYQALIDPFIEKLCEAAGEKLQNKKIEEWALRMRQEAIRWGSIFDSEPLLQFAARQSILAEKRAYIYWICNNRRWDGALENFMTYRFRFGLWCLMTSVGANIIAKELAQEQAASRVRKKGPCNWMAMLGDTFTRDELATVRKLKDVPHDAKSVSKQLSMWKSRGLIAPDPENPDRFKKI